MHDDPMLRGATGGSFAMGDYAISTALHVRYPHVGQGESTSALTSTAIRLSPTAPLEFCRRAADALGIWQGMTAETAQAAIADEFERRYREVGMPARVGDLNIPREDIPTLAAATVKNFNANPGARSGDDRVTASIHLLESAW